jgi:hypothetical protein
VRARICQEAHRVWRSCPANLMNQVAEVVVDVFVDQHLGLLVPWISSPSVCDPPDAAASLLVAGVVGNKNGVRGRPQKIGSLCVHMAQVVAWDERGENGRRPEAAVCGCIIRKWCSNT